MKNIDKKLSLCFHQNLKNAQDIISRKCKICNPNSKLTWLIFGKPQKGCFRGPECFYAHSQKELKPSEGFSEFFSYDLSQLNILEVKKMLIKKIGSIFKKLQKNEQMKFIELQKIEEFCPIFQFWDNTYLKYYKLRKKAKKEKNWN